MSTISGLVRRATLQAGPMARQYAEGNMIATVRVTRKTAATFNRTTGGAARGGTTTVYEGIGRVYRINGGPTMDLGDEPLYFTSATVSIPLSASRPHVNDVVTVLSHPDPNVVSRVFKVDAVAAGGQIPVAHEMACTGIQDSPTTS